MSHPKIKQNKNFLHSVILDKLYECWSEEVNDCIQFIAFTCFDPKNIFEILLLSFLLFNQVF